MTKWLLHFLSKLLMDRMPSPVEFERLQSAYLAGMDEYNNLRRQYELLTNECEDLRNRERGTQRRYDALIQHVAETRRPMPGMVPPIRTATEVRRQADMDMLRMEYIMQRESRPTRRRAVTPQGFTGTEPEDL